MVPLCVLAACGQPKDAPWLTYPDLDGHAGYLPLRGTSHDPTGVSSSTSCEGCHPGPSFKQFVCVTCHTPAATDPIHLPSLVPTYVGSTVTSADCYRCHPQGAAMTPEAHRPFFRIGTPSHPAACRGCHTDLVARTDPANLACVTCHGNRSAYPSPSTWVDPAYLHTSRNVLDYPVSAPTPAWCLRCHDAGDPATQSRHPRVSLAGETGTVLPGGQHPHCFACHVMVPPYFGGPGPGIPGRPWAQDWSQTNCRCH